MEEHIRLEKKEVIMVTSLIIGVIILLVLTTVRDYRIKQKSQAQTPVEIGVHVLSPLSDVELSGSTASVDLRANTPNGTQVLYDAQAQGEAAILEFMDKNPVVDVTAVSDNMQVKGASTEPEMKRVLPTNFRQNSVLSRTQNDRMYKDKNEIKHYYYTQKVAGIPVHGGIVRFDLAQNDKIVGVDGDYSLANTATPVTMTDQQALDIALTAGREDVKKINPSLTVNVCSGYTPTRKIFNEKILGISESDVNNVVLDVALCDSNQDIPHQFERLYYISLATGKIVVNSDLIRTALNRSIQSCSSGSCRVSRSEGQAAVSDSAVNFSYDTFGEIYNYYFNSFQRDSYDGRGAVLTGRVHASVPNAQWSPGSRIMSANDNYLAKDIWAHEMTHAVTGSSSRLGEPYGTMPQGDALNESISDMFGYLVDNANWTMGETSRAGAIRDISQPRRFGQPEKIFDSNFRCGGEAHLNNGPTNKAFYLMTAGGTFNGCTINGIGKEKSGAVIYKANNTYLRPNSGFFDFNNKVNQACADLYGATSSECVNVKAALQATELDQDRCGAGKPRTTPICAGGTQPTVGTSQPTNTPVPTSTTAPASTPGAGTGGTDVGVAQLRVNTECTAANGDIQYRFADYVCTNNVRGTIGSTTTCQPYAYFSEEAEKACVQSGTSTVPTTGTAPAATATPTSGSTDTSVPTATPALGVGFSAPVLNLQVRFQGIEDGPDRNGGNMVIKVGVVGGALDMPITQYVRFQADADGIFYGKATFPLLIPGRNYCVLIKGPLHIQKKICTNNPLEPRTGEYKRGNSTLAIAQGDNELDFSGIKMLVGDVDQNGVVNSFDLLYVRNSIGTTAAVDLERCDVNWDNACNGQDYALMVAALSVKTDDE